jgi:hypothetical protein
MKRKALLALSLALFGMLSIAAARNQPEPNWTPLFSVPLLNPIDISKYRSQLDDFSPKRSVDVKAQFQKANHALSKTRVGIEKIQPGKRWLIVDRTRGKTYDVWIDSNQLKAYECVGFIQRIYGNNAKVEVHDDVVEKTPPLYPLHVGDKIVLPDKASVDLRLQISNVEWASIKLTKINEEEDCFLIVKEPNKVELGSAEVEVDNHMGNKGFSALDRNGINTFASFTRYRIETGKAGTIVKSLEGYVELTKRVGESPTKIIRDYKAVIPADDGDETTPKEPITIVSPNRFISRYALSLLLPGTGRFYTRNYVLEGDIFQYQIKKPYLLPPTVTWACSLLTIGSALYYNVKREDAKLDSEREWNKYEAEINPNEVSDFYNQYTKKLDEADKYRRRRNILLITYGALGLYETVMVWLEHHEVQQKIQEFKEVRDQLYSSRFDINVRDDALVTKASWHFE